MFTSERKKKNVRMTITTLASFKSSYWFFPQPLRICMRSKSRCDSFDLDIIRKTRRLWQTNRSSSKPTPLFREFHLCSFRGRKIGNCFPSLCRANLKMVESLHGHPRNNSFVSCVVRSLREVWLIRMRACVPKLTLSPWLIFYFANRRGKSLCVFFLPFFFIIPSLVSHFMSHTLRFRVH